jgi:Zn-dependent protease with chaperone function
MQLTCTKCGVKTAEELRFCRNCRMRLNPETKFDLESKDFAYPQDLSAIEALKATGALPYILKRLMLGDFEKTAASRLRAQALQVTYPSVIDTVVRQCATLLSIEFLPETFITDENSVNGFTFGSEEQAYVVIDSSLISLLTQRELTMVIAHELGHVKSGHMTYHTLAEVLSGGMSLSASLMGLDLLSIPLRLALLSWHRESEVSADRAGLLAVNDVQVMKSLLPKLASGGTATGRFDLRKQQNGVLGTIGELLQTHPLASTRFRLAEEFWHSQEFRNARGRVEFRQKLLGALIPVCRYCGEGKQVEDVFCSKCGRSQT